MLDTTPPMVIQSSLAQNTLSSKSPAAIGKTLNSNTGEQTTNQVISTNDNTLKTSANPNATANHREQIEVSSGNPCPFLRMLVAQGMLPDGESDINQVNQAINKVIAVRDQPQSIPAGFGMGIKAVAITGNGINPSQIRHNLVHGVRLDNLRYHIFDKRGNGSRLLDKNARFVPDEMTRLKTFASPKLDKAGNSELGLNEHEIKAMMNANFARAKGYRKGFDRLLMEAEFPVLLKVIGKQGKDERYLLTDDIERLFKDRKLPERMETRLNNRNI